MTPAARAAAAIEILDAIVAGAAAEPVLTRWARQNRYAGSKDRAALRDIVFDALRNWRSDAVRGGGTSGRLRLLGRLRADGVDPDSIFSGARYAPAPLTDEERAEGARPTAHGDRWNLPDWMLPRFEESLGAEAEWSANLLTKRAPITLRANASKTTVDALIATLATEGITAEANPMSSYALTVTHDTRKLRLSNAFQAGLFEFQDAASQAVVDTIPPAERALDYCAGGGGKALALAARGCRVVAHDVDPARMVDIPDRAARAGADVPICSPTELARNERFDIVLVDAPCSGSGAWRRAPEGKWRLTPKRLQELCELQVRIAVQASEFVSESGILAYATCSLFASENEDQISAILNRLPEWSCVLQKRWNVSAHGDGFFVAHFQRVV